MTSKNKAALEAILPCPFCGAKPVIERGNNGSDDGTYDCSIECKNPLCEVSCGHVGFTVCSDKEAIDVWNKRASLTPHPPAWQEIGSAPRDCSEILVYDPAWSDRGIAHVFWEGDFWQVVGRDDATKHLRPTKWMHLPHPPTDGEKK